MTPLPKRSMPQSSGQLLLEAGMTAGESVSHIRLAQPTEEYIHTHRAIFFPSRRFPPELLQEIFQHCQEEHDDLGLNRPPWYLSHICQLWRQVALGMSTLWRHLPPMVHHPKYKRLDLSKLQFLLKHSSHAKITFLLYQTQHLVPNGVLPLLLHHCHRWERVTLYVSDYVCEVLSRSTVGRLLSLTTLTIDVQSLKRPHALFMDAPNLRALRCTGFVDHPMIQPPSTALSGPIPWDLTSYTSLAVLLDTHTLLKVLAQSQKLEKLDVALRGLIDPGLEIPPTTLPSLTSLALRFPPGPQIHESILSNLTLPCLTELFLGLFPPPRLLADLAGMITRSMCPLQHLNIQSSICHLNWNITNLLKLTPRLKSLEINGLVDQRLVEALCSWNQTEGWELVPFLEILTVHTHRPFNLGRLAVTRCELVHESGVHVRQRLETFFVVSFPPVDVLEDLRDIQISAGSKRLLDCLEPGHDVKENSKHMDGLLSVAKGIADADEILYLYYTRINIILWKFFFAVPPKLRLALNLRSRLEDLFTVWANAMIKSSSRIRWIWDRQKLKYVPNSPEDRALLFFHLKRSFLEDGVPVDRNFPYNEDQRPVNPF